MTTRKNKAIASFLVALMLMPTQGVSVRAFAAPPSSVLTTDHRAASTFDASSIIGNGSFVSNRAVTYETAPQDSLSDYSAYLNEIYARRLSDQGINYTINVESGYQCQYSACASISFNWNDAEVTIYIGFSNSVEMGSISATFLGAVSEPNAPFGQEPGYGTPVVSGSVGGGAADSAEAQAALSELASAQAEYSSAQNTLSSAQGQLQSANAALSQARSGVQSANARVAAANQSLAAAVSELNSLNSSLASAVSQRLGMESELSNANADYNAAAVEANQAAANARQSAQAAFDSRQELQRLEDQQASLSAQKAQLAENLTGLEREYQSRLANLDGLFNSLSDDTPTLTTQWQNASAAADTRLANHNGLLANINDQTKLQEGINSITIQIDAIGQLPTANAIDVFHFNTPVGTPEWQTLADASRYVQATRSFVAENPNYAAAHRNAILDIANSALNVADESYAAKDASPGDSLSDAVLGAVDLVYTNVLDNLTIGKGASFVMGVLEGVTGGIANATPIRGHESVYNVGVALGSVVGVLKDGALIADGFSTAAKGTALGVAGAPETVGTSLVVGAGAAAAGAAMASAGLAGAVLHYNAFKDALGELTSPDPPGKFTKGNFRGNLGRLTGESPIGSQAHHMFPQKFVEKFEKLGLDIHDPKYGTWWKTWDHLSNARKYNSKWEAFFETSPTTEQCLAFAKKLGEEYGLILQF